MTTPMPALNPTSTGSEMKLATKPRRKIQATIRMAPTSKVSVEAARSSAAESAVATAAASAAPVRIAIVVVVLTLKTREVPSSA